MKLAFVAEAPSHEEVIAGEPLVGPSGRLLWRMLRMAGIARTDQFPTSFRPDMRAHGLQPLLWARKDHLVTNVWRHQIEDNDLAKLFSNRSVADSWEREPSELSRWHAPGYGYLKPEFRSDLYRLKESLEYFAPECIIPLGAGALWAFTGSTSIDASRGIVQRATRIAPGSKIVPTLHPAHVLADYRLLGTVVADIHKAVVEVAEPGRIIHRASREFWIAPSIEDLALWEKSCDGCPWLACDIETNRGQITCIGFGARNRQGFHSAICVPFVDYRKAHRSYWSTLVEELAAWDWVAEMLMSPAPKVFQNGLYDLAYLWGKMGLKVNNYRHDTRLMQHVLQPELPKSLGFIGSTYCQPPLAWKALRSMEEEKREA